MFFPVFSSKYSKAFLITNITLFLAASILRFRAFLQSEFSEENLDFWIECEAYKHQKIYKQRKLAGKIYEKYVAAQAPREVSG